MSVSVDLINLILYAAQQLGVMLGVGAETIILILSFLSRRDGTVDAKEEEFGRSVRRVLMFGLWLMIGSGFLITAIHLFFGQLAVLLAPAFLLKWILIGVVWALEIARQKEVFSNPLWEGVAGANWYALFALHILAPVVAWADLLFIYVVGAVAFAACYAGIVYVLGAPKPHPKKQEAVKPSPVIKEEKKMQPPPPVPPIVKPSPRPEPVKIAVAKPVPPPAPAGVPKPPLPIVHPPQAIRPAAPTPPPAAAKPPPPVVPHKPAPVIPPVPHKPQNQIPIPSKPQALGDPDERPGLPAIRVMPRTPADVDKQNRPTSVQFVEQA